MRHAKEVPPPGTERRGARAGSQRGRATQREGVRRSAAHAPDAAEAGNIMRRRAAPRALRTELRVSVPCRY